MKRLCLLIFIFLLIIVPPATAQSNPISLEVEAGYGGTIKSGAWIPVTITATNSGSDVRGRLVWRWATGGTRFAQTIDLPRGAKKQLVMPVLADSFGSDARLELQDNTRVLASTTVRSLQVDGSGLVVAVLSDAATSLPELAGLSNMFGSGTNLVRLAPAALPERWELLQTLDILFVHAADTSTWSDAQRSALGLWMTDGGRIVVGGDQPATAAGFGTLLAASVAARVGEASLADLQPALNWVPRVGSPPVPVLGLEPASGSTVVAESAAGLPLIVRRDYGRGALIQTAFDLSAPSAQGQPLALWEKLTPQPGTQFQWQQLRSNGDTVLREALALPALRLPSIWTLLGFLGMYIVLVGPANYLVLRRFDRREWAYLTIPVTVVVFTLGAYALGALGRGGSATVTALSIVRAASNNDAGLSMTYLGVFSPARRSYQVDLGPDVLVSNTSSFGRSANDLEILRGEAAVELPSFLVDVGALRPLVAEQSETVPLVIVTVIEDGPTVRLEIENRSDIVLEDAAVAVADSIFKLPDIAPREKRIDEVDTTQPIFELDMRSNGVIERSAAINTLRWSFFAPLQTLAPVPVQGAQPELVVQERPIYLMAWTPTTKLNIKLNDVEQEVRGETLFLWTAAKAQ